MRRWLVFLAMLVCAGVPPARAELSAIVDDMEAVKKGSNFFFYQCFFAADPMQKAVYYTVVGEADLQFVAIQDLKSASVFSDIRFENGYWHLGGEHTRGYGWTLHRTIYTLPFRLVSAGQFKELFLSQPTEACREDRLPPAPPGPAAPLSEIAPSADLTLLGQNIVSAIKARNADQIRALEKGMVASLPTTRDKGGPLDSYIEDFFFVGEDQKQRDERRKAVVDLASAGDIHVKTFMVPDTKDRAVMFFMQEAFRREAESDRMFYADKYLIAYFACPVSFINGTWAPDSERSLCFAGAAYPSLDPHDPRRYDWRMPP